MPTRSITMPADGVTFACTLHPGMEGRLEPA